MTLRFNLAALTLTLTLCQVLVSLSEAQSCTTGFPSSLSTCTNCVTHTEGSGARTRLIPGMRFDCNGKITAWRAAGTRRSNRNINAMLGIWRETTTQGTYDRIATIELGVCDGDDVTPVNNVYNCGSLNVPVQDGDIIGIDIAANSRYRFRLHFDTSGSGLSLTNYVFNGNMSTATLSQNAVSTESQQQPQISLTVVKAATTEATMTTTQLSTTTEFNAPLTTTGSTNVGATTTGASTTVTQATSATTTETDSDFTSTTEAMAATATGAPTTAQTTVMTMDDQTTTTSEPSTTVSGVDMTTAGPQVMDTTTQAHAPITSASGNTGEVSNADAGTIAGAIVGAVIAILLVVVVVLLLVLVLRRQQTSHKYDTNGTNIINPVYDDNIAVQMPPSGAGSVGAYSAVGDYSAVGCDHTEMDYEDIENKADIPPVDRSLSYSINDYSKTPKLADISQYETPVQILPKGKPLPRSSANTNYESGILYVPSQEQRDRLSVNLNNGDVYSAIGMSQYSDSGPTPMLFEEDDIYWEPASDTNELYRQLSSKKYREIVRQQIQITEHLGAGQFGTVNKGIWQSPMGALDVAVKQLQPGAAEEEKVKFLQEAAINGQFRHPNVVKLMGVVTLGEPTMIVLELLSNGDLHNYLLKQQPSPGEILPSNTRQVLLKFCQQVASGMEYLARKAFVHRDLAARNILVAEDKTCKISDFGMSRDLMDENYYVSHGGKVPVKWTAPEALHFKKYSTASDVWSYGCVMYEIWSLGHKPFETYRNAEVIKMVESGCRLPPPPGLSKELYKIMIHCWHGDRSSRPTFPQLVEMLSRADFELFAWEDEDLNGCDPQAKAIGAALETAINLYPQLQRSYFRT